MPFKQGRDLRTWDGPGHALTEAEAEEAEIKVVEGQEGR